MPSWGELLNELKPRTDATGKNIPALTFDEDEIVMIPYGTKIYKILEKLGIYGKNKA